MMMQWATSMEMAMAAQAYTFLMASNPFTPAFGQVWHFFGKQMLRERCSKKQLNELCLTDRNLHTHYCIHGFNLTTAYFLQSCRVCLLGTSTIRVEKNASSLRATCQNQYDKVYNERDGRLTTLRANKISTDKSTTLLHCQLYDVIRTEPVLRVDLLFSLSGVVYTQRTSCLLACN